MKADSIHTKLLQVELIKEFYFFTPANASCAKYLTSVSVSVFNCVKHGLIVDWIDLSCKNKTNKHYIKLAFQISVIITTIFSKPTIKFLYSVIYLTLLHDGEWSTRRLMKSQSIKVKRKQKRENNGFRCALYTDLIVHTQKKHFHVRIENSQHTVHQEEVLSFVRFWRR